MSVILSVVVSLLVVVTVTVFWRESRSRRRRMLAQFPGDFRWPIIGNALQIGFDIDEVHDRLLEMWHRHGRGAFKVSIASRDWVMLTDPADIAVILNHPTEIEKAPERNAVMLPFFGESLSSSHFLRWKFMRKLISPSFSYQLAQRRLDVTTAHCERLLKKLDCNLDSPIEMYQYIKGFMNDVYCQSLLGVDSNLMDNLNNDYINRTKGIIRIVTENFYSYWRHIEFLFQFAPDYREMQETIKVITNKSKNILYERKRELQRIREEIQTNNPNMDIEHIFLEKLSMNEYILDRLILGKLPNGQLVTDDMIIEELNLISFTSHLTSTITLCNVLYVLSKHAIVQKKVLEEQRLIFEDDFLRKPNVRELNQMKYLDAVMKETLRTIPTVSLMGRNLQNDLQLKDGRTIPANVTAVVFAAAMYTDERFYADATAFKPERFLNEPVPTYAFIPFSAGPRNCIGFKTAWSTMKATLSMLLRNYEINSAPPHLAPQIKHRFVTESINGVHVVLNKRT